AAPLLENLWLAALAVLALGVAVAFQSKRREAMPGTGGDYVLRFWAHQLFQRDPAALSETRLDDLRRWCHCLELITQHNVAGVQSLADEECQFAVDVLDELCPENEAFASFVLVRESCRQSAYCRQAASARTDGLPRDDG